MRKGMWKKGLTVAMAAAMLAGPVSVPAMCSSVHGQNHVPYQRTDGLKAGNTIKKDHISVKKIQRILLLIQILN
ncbi:MAG: hypothetical protein ACLUTF_08095 [Anaerostipes hadrus]